MTKWGRFVIYGISSHTLPQLVPNMRSGGRYYISSGHRPLPLTSDMMTGSHVIRDLEIFIIRREVKTGGEEDAEPGLGNTRCDPRLGIFKDYEIVVWRTKNIFSS